MEAAVTLDALQALGHPTRLAVFRLLVEAGPAGLAVGEVRERLGLRGATLTAHLDRLRAAGLVHGRREGRWIRLAADLGRMRAVIDFLLANCCGGEPCAAVPTGAASACTAPESARLREIR